MIGSVYLLHYDEPISHAQHYNGWALDVEERANEHARGTSGAKLPAEFHRLGIGFTLARVWPNVDRHFERKLKNRKNGRALCPICNSTTTTEGA